MSVATEFAPEVFIPERARTPLRPADATVLTLCPPAPASVAAPLRLTRRGVLVLAALVALVAGIVVGLAAMSASSRPAAPSGPAPAVVTVHAGDTLWSIAGRVAPGSDPRAEVADLQRLNGLSGASLQPGQRLRTR